MISLVLGDINSNLLLRVQIHAPVAEAVLSALKYLEHVYGAYTYAHIHIYDTGVMGDQ